MFFLQFLYLDVLALHPFVLEANADVVDGQDGMSAVRTPHVGVEEDFHECPCLIRVDFMLDLVSWFTSKMAFRLLCSVVRSYRDNMLS